MRIDDRLKDNAIVANNEAVLLTVAKLAASAVNKLATDNSDILHSPANIQELEDNTTMLDSIVALKIKNEFIEN